MRFLHGVVLAVGLASSAAQARANPALERAEALLASYMAKSRAFDPSLADLYSDQALIENLRTYPTGEVRRLSLPAPQYKALMAKTMPLARARGDTNRYTKPLFVTEGPRVRISLTRYSEMKNYESPLVLIVGPEADGTWRILEERSQSRP